MGTARTRTALMILPRKSEPSSMIERKTWEEFRAAQLLWWTNRMLHLFGWAIVFDVAEDGRTVTDVYPARVRFRGFDSQSEAEGFTGLTSHLCQNADRLLEESKE